MLAQFLVAVKILVMGTRASSFDLGGPLLNAHLIAVLARAFTPVGCSRSSYGIQARALLSAFLPG